MKKTLLVALLLLSILFVNAALALTNTELEAAARPYVPSAATLAKTEKDDGLWELTFRLDRETWDVKLAPETGEMREVEYENNGLRGGKKDTLSGEQAAAAVRTLFPDVQIISTRKERDDGRYELELFIQTELYRGEVDLNAETGEVLSYDIFPSPAADFSTK